MARKSKRRAWTAADVRILKTGARERTPAARIARTLKRTERSFGASERSRYAAKVFKEVAERPERRDHARACVGNRIHVGPLGDDTEGMLAGLDDIGVSKPGPGGRNLVVGY